MLGFDTQVIRPYQIIENLRGIMSPEEGYLSLGKNTAVKKPGSFFDRFMGREIDLEEHRPIILTTENPSTNPFNFLSSLFGNYEHERAAGYLWFREGNSDLGNSYEPRFANLELRLWYPLKTEKGLLPYFNIKLSIETEEWGKSEPERADHIKKFHLYWEKTDLSKEIPTEWFLP